MKVSGDYKVRFDQAGLMIRIDKENWLKAGIEYVIEKYMGLAKDEELFGMIISEAISASIS